MKYITPSLAILLTAHLSLTTQALAQEQAQDPDINAATGEQAANKPDETVASPPPKTADAASKSWQEFNNLPIETRKEFNQKLIRAQSLFNQKRIFDTIQVIDELDKIFSDHPALLNLRGACYVEIRAFDKASPVFEKILTITPESTNVRFNLAEIDFVAKRWESAHKRFEDLLTRLPATNKPMIRLCEFKMMLCKLKTDRVAEAIALKDKYDEWDDSPFYYYSRAALKYHEGKKQEADRLLLDARIIWGGAGPLSSWQDTMIEFGFVRSFYGGESENAGDTTEEAILATPEQTPAAIPLDNQ